MQEEKEIRLWNLIGTMNGMNIVNKGKEKKDANPREWNMYLGTFAIRTAEKWHTLKVIAGRGDRDELPKGLL